MNTPTIEVPVTGRLTTPRPTTTTTTVKERKFILHEVPFTSQAPTGDWKNEIFQDGCEEASALMAECIMNNELCIMHDGIIDKEWARQKITEMALWQREKYGSAVDTSAADTAKRLLGEYFELSITNYEVKEFKDSQEILDFLYKDNILIIPMDGQKLGNPNFTAPGPERHMVVVIGYDPKTDELITNDGGTRKGKLYRYKRSVFWSAIRDYPTGDHEKILKVEKRGIVISLVQG